MNVGAGQHVIAGCTGNVETPAQYVCVRQLIGQRPDIFKRAVQKLLARLDIPELQSSEQRAAIDIAGIKTREMDFVSVATVAQAQRTQAQTDLIRSDPITENNKIFQIRVEDGVGTRSRFKEKLVDTGAAAQHIVAGTAFDIVPTTKSADPVIAISPDEAIIERRADIAFLFRQSYKVTDIDRLAAQADFFNTVTDQISGRRQLDINDLVFTPYQTQVATPRRFI